MKTTLTVEVEYDPAMTDAEGLACAMDRLLETALSTPGIFSDYGNPKVGEFLVWPGGYGHAWGSFSITSAKLANLSTTRLPRPRRSATPTTTRTSTPWRSSAVPHTNPTKRRSIRMTENDKTYQLHIDGELFRRQRELLVKIADLVRRKQPYEPSPSDEELLEGLLNLSDAIADQAHDQHGIDCLLDG